MTASPQTESLAERYARLSLEGDGPRGVDRALRTLDVAHRRAGAPRRHARPRAPDGRFPRHLGHAGLLRGRPRRPPRPRSSTCASSARFAATPRRGSARTTARSSRCGRQPKSPGSAAGSARRSSTRCRSSGTSSRGDMSIVGPRPIRPRSSRSSARRSPQYWQRLVVRPGLTGFAQTRMGREAVVGGEARARPRVDRRPLGRPLSPDRRRDRVAGREAVSRGCVGTLPGGRH